MRLQARVTAGAYLDDIFVVARPDVVAQWVARLNQELGARGTNLVAADPKQVVYVPRTSTVSLALLPREWRVVRDGTVFLGSPVGPVNFQAAHWQAMSDRDVHVVRSLQRMRERQSQMLLLRFCCNSRVNFMLRASPPVACLAAAARHDEVVRERLVDMAEAMGEHIAPLDVTMPLRAGGLGMPEAVAVAPAAFLGAVNDAAQQVVKVFPDLPCFGGPVPVAPDSELVVQVTDAMAMVAEAVGGCPAEPLPHTWQDIGALDRELQKRLTDAVARRAAALGPQVSEEVRARRLSQAQRGSAAVWMAIPSEPALTLDNHDLTVTLRHYLGLSIVPQAEAHLMCRCGKCPLCTVHVLSCQETNGRTDRHNGMRDEAGELAGASGWPVTVEPRGWRNLGDNSGPDLFLLGYFGGSVGAAVDVTVVSPLVTSNVHRAATVPLATCVAAERAKVAKYAEALAGDNARVLPLAFETTGAFGQGVLDFIDTCQKRYESTVLSTTFSSYGDTWTAVSFADYWSQRLAVRLRKGNAQMAARVRAAAVGAAWHVLRVSV